jgi:hypothetical protein
MVSVMPTAPSSLLRVLGPFAVLVALGGCGRIGFELLGLVEDGGRDSGGAVACLSDAECDDELPCTMDRCVEGRCQSAEAEDGTSCADGRFCTVDDRCEAGACVGTPRSCDDGDPCTLDSCDEGMARCLGEAVLPGPAEDDLCGDGIDQNCDGVVDGGDGTFELLGTVAVGDGPWYMTGGDLDGDGHADLVTNDRGDDTVSVLLGRGDGTFEVSSLSVGRDPFHVRVVDLDGDGALDILTANQLGPSVGVLYGRGDGTFEAHVGLLFGTEVGPVQVAVGDFDGDGALDVATCNWADDSYAVIRQTSNPRVFREPRVVSLDRPDSRPRAIAAADLNGDDRLDLVVTTWTAGDLVVLDGRGDGTFEAPRPYEASSQQVHLSLADFDGDGVDDLLVPNMDAARVQVLLGGGDPVGDGTFAAPQPIPTGAVPTSARAADLDGDCILDVAVSEWGPDQASVHLGVGVDGVWNGVFAPAATYAAGGNPAAIVVLDANEDGRLDLAVANHDGDSVTLLGGR